MNHSSHSSHSSFHFYAEKDPNVYEAEFAQLGGGAYFKTSHKGYSGTGYVSLVDTQSYIQWDKILLRSNAEYQVRIRCHIGNGTISSSSSSDIDLFIDGSWRKSCQCRAKDHDSWVESWIDSDDVIASLVAGYHSIRLQSRISDYVHIVSHMKLSFNF